MMTTNFLTEADHFFGKTDPSVLVSRFGSPLYVYNEDILRIRCREMQQLVDYPKYVANYSVKANANLKILEIVRDEGLSADAMSPGEIVFLEKAGFRPDQIFFVPNNVSADEIRFALDKGILVSLDSLSQLVMTGEIAPGSRVAIRINPGVGAGHHEKVVTGGKKTKFGISADQLGDALRIAEKHRLKIVGVNQHIGSLFMEPSPYLLAAGNFFEMSRRFPDLELVDLGGGFGIPYHKIAGEGRLDLAALRQGLTRMVRSFVQSTGRDIQVKIEPGRYIVAECGVLLGTVHALKENSGTLYAGTDMGFNNLARPVMYDSWHDMLAFRDGQPAGGQDQKIYTIVGNICESGDILARDRPMPPLMTGDIIAVLDAGAYGYSMSSNYNNRLRPAEVLIKTGGEPFLIRRRDTVEDLFRGFPGCT
jgi:diaminopimelate decarboxylase